MTDHEKELCALVDQFDDIHIASRPFIRVPLGIMEDLDDVEPCMHYRYGFLIKEEADFIEVSYLDMVARRWEFVGKEWSVNGWTKGARRNYEKADIVAYAAELTEKFNNVRNEYDQSLNYYRRPDDTMDPRGRAMVLTRELFRRGMINEARLLLNSIQSKKTIKDEFAAGIENRIYLYVSDRNTTRETILSEMEKWMKAFPSHFLRERVERQLNLWAKSAAGEDAAAVAQNDKEKRIKKLIFELRNEVAPPKYPSMSIDGNYLIFRDDPWTKERVTDAYEKEKSQNANNIDAVGELLKIGFDACPQLIESLNDETPTRCVRYHSRHGAAFYTISTGDYCEDMLQLISGLELSDTHEGRIKLWRDWYQNTKIKGEENALVEVIHSGKDYSNSATTILLEKYPARIPEILAEIRKGNSEYAASNLISLLWKYKDPRIIEFLREELESTKSISIKIAAARTLLQAGVRDGLDLMMRQWELNNDPGKIQKKDVPEAVKEFDQFLINKEVREELAGFLLNCDDTAAVKLVGRNILKQPFPIRSAVLNGISRGSWHWLSAPGSNKNELQIQREHERILVMLLSDKEGGEPGSKHWFSVKDRSVTVSSPRNADLAACALANHFPDRYHYDPTADLTKRDRALIELNNIWLKSEGLPTIPLPDAEVVAPLDAATQELLETILKETNSTKRDELILQLEKRGLPILPWLQDRLDTLSKEDAAKLQLESAANRLANYVNKATLELLTDDPAWKTAAVKVTEKIKSLEGKPLDAKTMIQMLIDLHTDFPGGGDGEYKLVAERGIDGRGILLNIKIQPRPDGTGKDGAANYSITIDGAPILSGGGGGVRGGYDTVDSYLNHSKAYQKAFATSHRRSFTIQLNIRFD